MVSRARELLIGANLSHIIDSFNRMLERHHFSAEKQTEIALALFETETINDWPAVRHTVH